MKQNTELEEVESQYLYDYVSLRKSCFSLINQKRVKKFHNSENAMDEISKFVKVADASQRLAQSFLILDKEQYQGGDEKLVNQVSSDILEHIGRKRKSEELEDDMEWDDL